MTDVTFGLIARISLCGYLHVFAGRLFCFVGCGFVMMVCFAWAL